MNHHFEILIKLFIYVLYKFKSGKRFSVSEKGYLLSGLYTLGVDFFSQYIPNEARELGTSRMEISTYDNLCLSDKPYIKNEEEIHDVLQVPKTCSTMPSMSSRIRPKCKRTFPKTFSRSRNIVKMASRRSQSS